MLAAGHAYRCYLTSDELTARREKAQAERRPFRIDSEWRDADAASWPEGQPYVVRIKAPHDGETAIDDEVQGRITVANVELDDFVLLRSDGTPTYMLAVVVDDHDMGVTTSSAATITSTTPFASWSSSARCMASRAAEPIRSTLTSR